ncbi:MAG TPA: tripartite tricarboxylate transporter substrate-binding protein, partial [Paracoccaceae bacterium]|nr:tripartite tricarboxylate transporter substrate-binding protein [Paracoccaceae bacterium]
MRLAVLAVLWLAAGGAAQAADRALVLANSNYAEAADMAGALAAGQAVPVLRAEGFAVISGTDLDAAGLRARLSQMLVQLAPGDRLVILLSGHFATSGSETWFLGTEVGRPDLATVGAAGVSLSTVLRIAAEVPGGAVLLLGTEQRRIELGRGLGPGIGVLDVPQGVTVVRGDAVRVADFAARQMTRRGVPLPQMLSATPDLRAEGFLAALPFRPDAVTAPPPVATAPPPPGPTAAERAEDDRQAAAARQAGDRWNYGTPGVGTVGHIGMDLLKSRAGIAPVHVPYPGNPQVINAMLSGELQMALLPPGL